MMPPVLQYSLHINAGMHAVELTLIPAQQPVMAHGLQYSVLHFKNLSAFKGARIA
jgi:hypothetical protein